MPKKSVGELETEEKRLEESLKELRELKLSKLRELYNVYSAVSFLYKRPKNKDDATDEPNETANKGLFNLVTEAVGEKPDKKSTLEEHLKKSNKEANMITLILDEYRGLGEDVHKYILRKAKHFLSDEHPFSGESYTGFDYTVKFIYNLGDTIDVLKEIKKYQDQENFSIITEQLIDIAAHYADTKGVKTAKIIEAVTDTVRAFKKSKYAQDVARTLKYISNIFEPEQELPEYLEEVKKEIVGLKGKDLDKKLSHFGEDARQKRIDYYDSRDPNIP